ncbi:hypothetical protein BpHYR1_042965 [Brachionus plicatilis]|uniref:Uncharacterized protein n=1 Tax=Brachionus plicatilis TaxID=10195 RepID=A0A3M7P581_BRAPC|nr:hypothetical protein BpHYR1_042965 [Brachionus plicatilis]
MNFKSTLLIPALLASISVLCIQCSDEKSQNARIEPVTTSILATALSSLAVNLFQGLLGSLFKPSDYQDTVIFGRPMRIKMCGDACVQITDRGSSITSTGTGTTLQEALGDATKKIFDELLKRNLLSLHDLCVLHITFPHPNQAQCPGAIINPCDLLHPVLTTPTPCVNKVGDSYCNSNVHRCEDHLFQTFMHHNCWKACTNGLCNLNTGPVDPCKV